MIIFDWTLRRTAGSFEDDFAEEECHVIV
jgi:hypothetical protein